MNILAGMASGVVAGTAGAWGGYQVVASHGEVLIEIDRLAVIHRPDLNPVTHITLGATAVANTAALLVGVPREIAARKR